ncbi:MAG: hypothetical protein IT426_14760 [Pirellulales bacterium]|nr:hypothetical protein [Pirellulales bacterium]
MLTTLTFCASLLLPLAETEKAAEKTSTAPAAKTENTVPTEIKSNKPAVKTEDNALAEKKAEKTAKPKQDEDKELLAIEANVVSYTNNERARYGLPPLEVDKQLMSTAREHCSWMTWNRIFQHTRRSVAENIAMGQPSSRDVVRSWMNSSGHRANILNPNHRRIGVGAYRTEGGTIYWVQQFSR